MDEAGRGPWAGPVVAAAVLIERWDFAARIDDSKRLTAAARERAFGEILHRARIGVGLASHETIDHLNILQATRLAMIAAVHRLGLVPEIVLVDGQIPPLGVGRQVNIIHGDQRSCSIACASIVAKVVRDRIMAVYERRFPGYAFGRHKGYGTQLHHDALRRLGPSPIHRQSFLPVQRVLAIFQSTTAR